MEKQKKTRPERQSTPVKKAADGGRVFRNGMYANLFTAIALAAAILIGLVVGAIPTKYTEFDLSDTGVYTLSDTTKNILDGLTQDVTIYYMAQTGSEDAVLTRLLDRYAESSSHVKWEEKDPAVYPTFASQYDADNATEGSLVVVSGDKSNLVDYNDLYPADYSDYSTTGSASYSFDGENALTTAIFNVTSGESSTAYYVTNHGETAPSSSLTSAIEAQNITLNSLDLLAEGVPSDCDLLILINPQNDLSGASDLVNETAELEDYLAGGGKLILLTDPAIDTPNLDSVMAEYGLSRVQGIVAEGDSQHHLSNAMVQNAGELFLLPDLATGGESRIADGLASGSGYLLPKAQGIQAADSLPEDVTTEALLTTSDAAYSKVAGADMTTTAKEDGDIAGPFNLAVWASNTANGSQVVWIGSGMFGDSNYDVYGYNSQFLLASAAALTNQGSDTLVDAKALESSTITVSSGNVLALGAVFLLILPAALIVAGIVVAILRRRK